MQGERTGLRHLFGAARSPVIQLSRITSRPTKEMGARRSLKDSAAAAPHCSAHGAPRSQKQNPASSCTDLSTRGIR